MRNNLNTKDWRDIRTKQRFRAYPIIINFMLTLNQLRINPKVNNAFLILIEQIDL